MTTLRCPACLRTWREGGPYACDCLDDKTLAANEYQQTRVEVELAPLSCLLAALLIFGAVLYAGVRGLLRLVGVWP